MKNESISQEYLKSILNYNPDTGIFTWKINKSIGTKSNDIAGAINDKGYVKISINSKGHSAHRLAWLYMNGVYPPNQIDHINKVRSDNRFKNLRLATNKQNQENTSIRKDNSSGTTGINWRKDLEKWQVRIQSHGKRITVGIYSGLELAIEAREKAEEKYYTHRNNNEK
jgi:hypothetical protein